MSERRAFLTQLVAASTLWLGGCVDEHVRGSSGEESILSDERVLEVLSLYFPGERMESAVKVGWAATASGDRDSKALEDLTKVTLEVIDEAESAASAVMRLRELVTRDFWDARTGDVLGWVLSETEIELCLLAAATQAATE